MYFTVYFNLDFSASFSKCKIYKNISSTYFEDDKKTGETDEALDNADLDYLQKLHIEVKETLKSTEHEQVFEIKLDEDCIKEKFSNAFEALRKKEKDTPIHPCVSCEKLCYRRNITEVAKKAGIYQKLNITNPKEHYTKRSYLDLLSECELQNDMSNVFFR